MLWNGRLAVSNHSMYRVVRGSALGLLAGRLALSTAFSFLMGSEPSQANCLALPERDLQSLDTSIEANPEVAAAEISRRLAKGAGNHPFIDAQLYAILADARAEQSRVEESLAAAARGLDLLSRVEPSPAVARLKFRIQLLQSQSLIVKPDSAGTVAAVTRLVQGIGPSTIEYTCALSVRALAYYYLGESDRSAADALAAYRLAKDNGWTDARKEVVFTLAGLFGTAGLDDQAQAMLDEVRDIALSFNQTSLLSTVEFQRGELYLRARRFDEARRALDLSAEYSKRTGDRFSVAAATTLLCGVFINQRDFSAAEAVCNAGDQDLAAGHREDLLTLQRAYRARLDIERGRPQAALTQLSMLTHNVHKLLPRQEPQVYRDRARAYTALGRYQEAAADLTHAADIELADDTDARNRRVAVLSAIVTAEKLTAANGLLQQRNLHYQEDLANQRKANRLASGLAVAAGLFCATFAYLFLQVRRHTRDLRRRDIIQRSASSRAPDAIILLDEARIVRLANRNICGDGPAHPEGRPIGEGVPESLWPELNAAIERALVTREIVDLGAEIVVVGSAMRLFDICILPAVDEDAVIGVSLRSIEVTDTRALEREVLDSAALERQRLSSELHEGLGQQLAGVLLMLGNLTAVIKRGLTGADQLVGEISKHVVQSIESTRQLAQGLAPVQIGSGSLSAALRSLVKAASRRLAIDVTCDCRLDDRMISHIAAEHLYRICREAISNAALHGRCTRVNLDLDCCHEHVILNICDDGVGVPSATSTQGFGLKMMTYRAQALGGRLSVNSLPEGGTQVTLTLPLSKVCAADPATGGSGVIKS